MQFCNNSNNNNNNDNLKDDNLEDDIYDIIEIVDSNRDGYLTLTEIYELEKLIEYQFTNEEKTIFLTPKNDKISYESILKALNYDDYSHCKKPNFLKLFNEINNYRKNDQNDQNPYNSFNTNDTNDNILVADLINILRHKNFTENDIDEILKYLPKNDNFIDHNKIEK